MNTKLTLFLSAIVFTASSVLGSNTTDEDPPNPLDIFRKQVLDRHNELRAIHGTPPLNLSAELNEYAQGHAERCAMQRRLVHSDLAREEPIGENLYYRTIFGNSQEYNGSLPVQAWYNEISRYDFDKAGAQSGSLHFTQVIWRGSKELGVGLAKSADGQIAYIVANYRPQGNVILNSDYWRQNVPPPQ